MKENQLTKESLEKSIETMKLLSKENSFLVSSKIPFAVPRNLGENFKKLKPEEQKEVLDLYDSIVR